MRRQYDPAHGYLDDRNQREASDRASWNAKKPRRIRDESVDAFIESEAWQRYLWTMDPGLLVGVMPEVTRCERVTRRVTREDGDLNIWLTIPASFFVGLDRHQAQDVFRLLARDTYVWGMEKFGWPEPPPVPGGVPPHASRIPPQVRGLTASEGGRRTVADVEWTSATRKRQLAVNERGESHPGWQDYLQQVNRDEDLLVVLRVTDDAEVGFDYWTEPDPDSGSALTTVEVTVPAALLMAAESAPDDVAWAAVHDGYRLAAQRFGWPSPPAP